MNTIRNPKAFSSGVNMERTSRYPLLFLGMLLLASAVVGLLRFNSFQVGGYSDDAHYLVLAESLATGQGYRLINFPQPQPEWAFPPGWPLLLSPLMAVFPGQYEVAKYLSFLLWLGSIPLLYRLFVKRIETPYLEILLALIILSPVILGIASMVISEAAYIFFSLLTLCLFELWEDRRANSKSWILIIAFSMTAIYTQMIRTVGISMQLALLTCLLLSRRIRQAGIVVGVLLLGMLPQVWLNQQNGGSIISYGYQNQGLNHPAVTILEHVWVNMQGYAKYLLANSLVHILGSNTRSVLEQLGLGFAPVIVNAAILLLIVLGFVLAIKQSRISDAYVIFYFAGILTFWIPNYGGVQSRFLVPMIPFLYFYLLLGSIWCVRFIVKKERRTRWVIAGAGAMLLLLLVMRNLQDWRDPIRNRITDLSIGRTWVAENTPATSVVMSQNPVPDYLYARRKTIAYPTEGQDVEKYIQANGINYIIISPKLANTGKDELTQYVETHLLPVLTFNQDKYKPVYVDPDHNVTVYQYLAAR